MPQTTTSPPRLVRGSRPVPWITMWSEEHLGRTARSGLVAGPDRMALLNPVGYRYYRGLVWQDEPDLRGNGTPVWKQVHTARAATSMELALCQVCGGPATRPDGTTPWVLPSRRAPNTNGALVTEDPPTCDGCITEALDACPALHSPYVLTVAEHRLCGWVANLPSTDGWTGLRWVFDKHAAAKGVVKRRLAALTSWEEAT